MGDKVQGSGFRVSPRGVPSLDCVRKRGEWALQVQRVQRGQQGWCGAFRHPERRKTSYVKNGLSENMRTESKDLSAAEIGN